VRQSLKSCRGKFRITWRIRPKLRYVRQACRLTHPLTDHAFGHRTIFFRDPDGNVIEIYAEI